MFTLRCTLFIISTSTIWRNCKTIPRHKQSDQLLTSYCEFSRPSDDKATKLDFTGIIPNIVFLYFLNGQDVPLLKYTGPPLLWMALLCVREQAGQNTSKHITDSSLEMSFMKQLVKKKRFKSAINKKVLLEKTRPKGENIKDHLICQR